MTEYRYDELNCIVYGNNFGLTFDVLSVRLASGWALIFYFKWHLTNINVHYAYYQEQSSLASILYFVVPLLLARPGR